MQLHLDWFDDRYKYVSHKYSNYMEQDFQLKN